MKTANAIDLKDEERTRCEIWTRVMGYHRPVSAFNPGKKSEHAERICFEECKTHQPNPHLSGFSAFFDKCHEKIV